MQHDIFSQSSGTELHLTRLDRSISGWLHMVCGYDLDTPLFGQQPTEYNQIFESSISTDLKNTRILYKQKNIFMKTLQPNVIEQFDDDDTSITEFENTQIFDRRSGNFIDIPLDTNETSAFGNTTSSSNNATDLQDDRDDKDGTAFPQRECLQLRCTPRHLVGILFYFL